MIKSKFFKVLSKKEIEGMEKIRKIGMGYKKIICGLDEAGREALAGPIVIAGVVLLSVFRFQRVFNGVLEIQKNFPENREKLCLKLLKNIASG